MNRLLTVQIIAFLHLLVYVGVMWYCWRNYKLTPKRSWMVMAIGFLLLLMGRVNTFYFLMQGDTLQPDAKSVGTPFIGGILILIAFWMLGNEHRELFTKMGQRPLERNAGTQPVEFWLEHVRVIVREELDKTVTVVKTEGTVD